MSDPARASRATASSRPPAARRESLSAAQARRIALAAQGFTDKAHATPTMRTLRRTVERTGVLQVDSVNVLARAHLMPLYSRMGGYDPALLQRASSGRRQRLLVEYWAHVQALMPVELWPVMRHRMATYRDLRGKWWGGVSEELATVVHDAVADLGASTAREIEHLAGGPAVSKKHWGWNWSEARKALDFLFMVGDLAIAGRNSQFEVVYDLPERVIPEAHLEGPVPSASEARLELVRRAARSHGVATTADLRDYYRINLLKDTQDAVDELVAAGELLPVTVEGWKRPGYLHAEAALPRRVSARAVLSPFDPVVWHRDRSLALFDFHYRIEIYTPAHKRIHGYYVLPFLLGDRVVGRVDLKADRATGRLLVHSAWAEPDAPADSGEHLALELRRLADWLTLDEIVVTPRGDLAPALAGAVRG